MVAESAACVTGICLRTVYVLAGRPDEHYLFNADREAAVDS